MAGTPVSGTLGNVKVGNTQVCDCTKWDFDQTIETHKYCSNCTGQYKVIVPGSLDGKGTISGMYDVNNPPQTTFFDISQFVTLKLYVDTIGFYQIPALVTGFKITVDMDSGAPVSWEMNFDASGAWTRPAAGLTAPRPPVEMTSDPYDPATHGPRAPAGAPTAPVEGAPVAAQAGMTEERFTQLMGLYLGAAKNQIMEEVGTIAARAAAEAASAAVRAVLAERNGHTDATQKELVQAA